jgi:carbonic anhydrase
LQFHFHAKSEHTIDGRRYDLEMHTVHLAGEGAKAASGRRLEDTAGSDGDIKIWASALGIMFDRTDYDSSITADEITIIDKFFE